MSSASPERDSEVALDPFFTFDFTAVEDPGEGQRWSTWSSIERLCRGPEPRPDWVVTDDSALDTELGVLKTGKEADVFLLERTSTNDTSRTCVMAAKRYRGEDHRTFHRSASYTEGRRTRRSRDARALAKGTEYGRAVAAGQWAWAEWEALNRFWSQGIPVPYPVQVDGTEILMEFVTGPDGTGAPRLAQARSTPALLSTWFEQLREAMIGLVRAGFAHGDLSAYNVLAAGERLVVIDLPQAVDVVGNPQGMDFLHRDCRNIARWFSAKGHEVDEESLFADLLAYAF
ncbi:serine/threonine protein kinase [Luteipulveratus sp. YIM 133132]|uniref:non-specific serine/threonine protein kinase n=1 Tax=Luteipulveratus flavus TaxID=3031728 RepID=A0ABT6C8L1_9MICO|nr:MULTISPECIES: RIO1 family regulatory kinase/ATPase [unclassified Luteipulveratus]MDE9366128.1 serine/threonine protein kinase [Luteipulveratus sp. YIM 133132]MDF8265220.1 serine/threonine protein kinase [Luteipulveratus sp. YIM 133296]